MLSTNTGPATHDLVLQNNWVGAFEFERLFIISLFQITSHLTFMYI